MAEWVLEHGMVNQPPVGRLTQASSRKFSFHLAAPSTVSFDLPGRHPDALRVTELATDVRLRRDGVLLFGGRIMSGQDEVDSADHVYSASGVDLRGVLSRRLVQRARTYTNTDATVVVRDLLIDAQTGPAAGLRIDLTPLTPVSVPVTRTVQPGASVLAELTAAATSAFDWDLVPIEGGGWAPRVWKRRGSTAPVDTLSLIDGERSFSVAGFSRESNVAEYANQIRVSGGVLRESGTVKTGPATVTLSNGTVVKDRSIQAPTAPVRLGFVDGAQKDYGTGTSFRAGYGEFALGPRAIITQSVTDSTGLTLTVEVPTEPVTLSEGSTLNEVGLYALVEAYPDIVSQAALDAKAAERFATVSNVVPTYSVTTVGGWWRGPSHVWLGDLLRLRVKSGRLDEDVILRVTDIDLELGDSGEETVSLTVGAASRTVLTDVLDTQRRLLRLQTAMTG